jgi:hypothetical protein
MGAEIDDTFSGQPLPVHDAMVDALEEVLDAAVYLAQAVIERDGRLPWDAS